MQRQDAAVFKSLVFRAAAGCADVERRVVFLNGSDHGVRVLRGAGERQEVALTSSMAGNSGQAVRLSMEKP